MAASDSETGAVTMPLDASLVGVKGWLLFLCVSLVILSPLMGLVGLVNSWPSENLLSLYDLRAALYCVTTIEIACQVFMAYAGIRLWMVAPGAVATAKLALLACLAVPILEPFLMILIAQAPSAFASGVWQASVMPIVRVAVYVGIWMSYLSTSKRVAATYR